MAAMTFDTFKFVDILKKGGMTPDQAQAISAAVQYANEFSVAQIRQEQDNFATKAEVKKEYDALASKADLRELKLELQGEIASVRKDLRNEIDLVRKDMELMHTGLSAKIDTLGWQLTVKLGGLIVVLIGALAAIMKL